MTSEDNRRERRFPVALRIKLRYARVEQFISKFATNLSRNGMFLASRSPKPVGTQLYFELRLADDSRVIEGVGEVRWTREYDKNQPDVAYGMGIHFLELEGASREVLAQAIKLREARGDVDLDSIPGERRPSVRRAVRIAPVERTGEDGAAGERGPPREAEGPATPDPGGASPAIAAPGPVEPGPAAREAAQPRPGRVTGLMADASSDVVDERGGRVADAVRRARELAQAFKGADDQELAELLERDAVPRATVDQASRELATREIGVAVDSRRYRAPRVEDELADAPAAPAARDKPVRRSETIDAALLALEAEESRGAELLDQLAEAGHAEDREVLDDLGALRHASLAAGGRAGTDIPIEVEDDDVVLELVEVEVEAPGDEPRDRGEP